MGVRFVHPPIYTGGDFVACVTVCNFFATFFLTFVNLKYSDSFKLTYVFRIEVLNNLC